MNTITYTATIKRGKPFDSIIIPHCNRLMYYKHKSYIKITLIDRILISGHKPRIGTLAAVKLLETIRVNTRSLITIQTYDEFYSVSADTISLFIDNKDEEKVNELITKFSFQYSPNKHWHYWLKRWLLSFEDTDDEVVEKPLYKDTNTIILQHNEYRFVYNSSNFDKHEWIASCSNYEISLSLEKSGTENYPYVLVFKLRGNDDLSSITSSVSRYLFYIARALKPVTSNLILLNKYIQMNGDYSLITKTLDAFIITHPITVTEVKNIDDVTEEMK